MLNQMQKVWSDSYQMYFSMSEFWFWSIAGGLVVVRSLRVPNVGISIPALIRSMTDASIGYIKWILNYWN